MDQYRRHAYPGANWRPEKGEKFSAVFIPQWAGVYALPKKLGDRSRGGRLAGVDIEAHGLFRLINRVVYKEQFAGPLKNYWVIGNDDVDKSYFLRMYLSCYQALEYLMSRQIGMAKLWSSWARARAGSRPLMLAGLHPKNITAAMPLVPSGCVHAAPERGARHLSRTGFPTPGMAAIRTKCGKPSRYFDAANFARRIKVPGADRIGVAG